MDPANSTKLVLGCLLLIVVSVIGILAPQAMWALSSWRYRNTEAMEPTEAQYTVHRARYAALLSLSVPPLIGLGWPGEGDVKVRVWMISAVASVAIIVAVLVLVGIMRRKRRGSTINHGHPSELSDAGYGVEWFGVVYTFIYVLVIVAIFAGLQASTEQRRQDAIDRADHTRTPEEEARLQEMLDEIARTMPTYTPPSYVDAPPVPVYTAVPEGLFVGGAVNLQTNAAGESRLVTPANVCPLAGIVVIESSVNVSVSFAFDASAAGTVEPSVYCVKTEGKTFYAAPMPVELGDRVALTLLGNKLAGGSY